MWPLLVGLDSNNEVPEPIPGLKSHPKCSEVTKEVEKSLKRIGTLPPNAPNKTDLQSQLIVLILQIIEKYPHLNCSEVQ